MPPNNMKKGNNPRNPESSLFKRLTRLFSGPVVNYNQQQVRQFSRRRLDKYAKNFRSAQGLAFKKRSYNPYENLLGGQSQENSRAERYVDFDQMEYTPELASALDIYADEITTHTSFEKVLSVKCFNEEIRLILESFFYQVLNIDSNLFGWARTLCKYGDYFLYLDIDEDKGIKSVIGLPAREVERMEGQDPTNPNYVQYQWNSGGITLENWQVAHFRVLGNDKFAPYGTSVLDPARRIWRQLTMMEDAMMAYRIVRAPDRRVFYIDIGGIPPEDVEQFMQSAMTQMKRHQLVDDTTGRVDLRYNPASIEEDFYIPVRGGASGTKIENLGGQARANDIEDVKYLRDKIFSAIKIPASYLARDENASEDKTTLSQKDIRFARTVQRLQRTIISELEKMAIIHLYTLGYRGQDLVNFKLSLNNPSKIAQMQDLEQHRLKFEIANSATQSIFSNRWVSENVFNISEEEFIRNQREKFYDKKYEGALAKLVQTGEAEFGLGGPDIGGAAGLGLEAGDDPILPEPELEAPAEVGEVPPPTPAPETPEAPEEEGVLLPTPAEAPAARDEDWYKIQKPDGSTTTSKSKDRWYMPKKAKGEPDLRNFAGRKKNYTQKQQHGPTRSFAGYTDIKQLGRGSIMEEKSIYNADKIERQIFESTNEVERLIKGLEKNKNETKS